MLKRLNQVVDDCNVKIQKYDMKIAQMSSEFSKLDVAVALLTEEVKVKQNQKVEKDTILEMKAKFDDHVKVTQSTCYRLEKKIDNKLNDLDLDKKFQNDQSKHIDILKEEIEDLKKQKAFNDQFAPKRSSLDNQNNKNNTLSSGLIPPVLKNDKSRPSGIDLNEVKSNPSVGNDPKVKIDGILSDSDKSSDKMESVDIKGL